MEQPVDKDMCMSFNDLPIDVVTVIINMSLTDNFRESWRFTANKRMYVVMKQQWMLVAREQLILTSPYPLTFTEMCNVILPTSIRPYKGTFRIKFTTNDASSCNLISINVWKNKADITILGYMVHYVPWNNIYVPVEYYRIDFASERPYDDKSNMRDLISVPQLSKILLSCIQFVMARILPELLDVFVLQ